MGTECSEDTKKEAFKIALKTGQYDTALNLYKEFEINMKSFLFVNINDLSPKQLSEYKKSVLFIEQAKKECLKETKKELTKGFLGKEKVIPDCQETDALFTLLLKTANGTNKKIVREGEKLINDYKKLNKSDNISLLDKYYKEKKIRDYSKNTLSDIDIYKKYNFNPSSSVRTLNDFFFLLPNDKNLTDEELMEVYNTAYNFNNDTYENEEKDQPDEVNRDR